MSRPRHEQQQQQQKQQLHLGSSASGGVGVVTESVAFKLVCDMQHLRGKVDLMCSLGAGLAQRWVAEVVHLHHHHLQQKHHQAVESRLRSEMEELVLELVDVSVEIQRMKERKELAQRFFYLAERRRSWCQVYDEDDTDEDEAEDVAFGTSTTSSTSSSKEGEAKAMMQLIDLDECDQVIDRLTTLLLGYLTAGEREEEERALRIKAHLDMSAADALLRQPISSSGPPPPGALRLLNSEHDDNLLR
jgi:hypothetical protein